jgi:hypothetical protein
MPTGPRNDRLSKAEIRKDALQDGVTAASHVVGSVATILTTAVGDVARAVGGFATEIFEIRDSARRAQRDHGHEVVEPTEPVVSVVEDPQQDDQPEDQPKES